MSSLEIEVTACAEYGGLGNLHYVVSDPYPFYRDFITVVDAAEQVVHEATYFDDPEFVQTEFQDDVALAPGAYTIIYTAERETGGANIDRQAFTIGACPELDLSVTTSCSTGADGSATISFTGLVEGESYRYDVVGAAASSDSFVATGPDETIVVGGLPPGNSYVYVEWRPGESAAAAPVPVFDWRGFAVEPCQPEIALEVAECTAAGGTGSVVLTLSSLVAGVEYEVAVTDLGDADGAPYGGVHLVTGDESGTAQLTLTGLPAGQDFTARVDGAWTTGPWEEPPFVGSGDFTPLETVYLTASADFSLPPCPAPAVTPVAPEPAKPAVLPATGFDGAGGLLAAGALLVLAGGIAILARRRTGPHPD